MVSPNRDQPPGFLPLSRKCFPCNLTNSWKPLDAMSHKLPNPVINTEQQQIHTYSSSSASSSTNNASPVPGSGIVSSTLRQKAVEEIWREVIQRVEQGGVLETLGETTPENFSGAMMGDGTVFDPKQLRAIVDPMVLQRARFVDAVANAQQSQRQQQMPVLGLCGPLLGNAIAGGGYVEDHQRGIPITSTVPMVMSGPALSVSQAAVMANAKQSNETLRNSIERRKKRLIKNRESAAKSRAKKQAYIDSLEDEVKQLAETNRQLMKQKEVDMLKQSGSIPAPQLRNQHRRTRSAPF